MFSHRGLCFSLYLGASLLTCVFIFSIYQYMLRPSFYQHTHLMDLSSLDDINIPPPSVKDIPSRSVADSRQSQQTASPPRCSDRPFTNIVFLKIHKSGSTTIANLLARYALTHDLNIALPNKPLGIPRSNYFPSSSLEKGVVPLAEGQQYNVLFNHMIYNRTALDRVMPRGTFYCSIMRDPLSRFISSVNYYGSALPMKMRQYLFTNYDRNSQAEEPDLGDTNQQKSSLAEVITGDIKVRVERLEEIYNSIASDSGLPVQDQKNTVAVMKHVRKLDRELDLMMVMERFHESLVLLKRRACLHMKDILYLQLNSAKRHRLFNLTDADRDFVQSWQMADKILYKHFYEKFNIEAKKEGSSFQEEVKHFQEILFAVKKFCSSSASMENDVLVIRSSPWNSQFTMNAKDYVLMNLKELNFQQKLIFRATMRNLRTGKG